MDIRTHYADLFGRDSDSLSVLEQNVKDFPASAIARFSLLYHYKKNNNPEFEKFADQTSLYFNNSYWLREQLSQDGVAEPQAPVIVSEPAIMPDEPENLEEFISKNNLQAEENIERIDENVGAPIQEDITQHSHEYEFRESEAGVDKETQTKNGKADFLVSPDGDITDINTEETATHEEVSDPINGEDDHNGNADVNSHEPFLPAEVENLPAENITSLNDPALETSEIPETVLIAETQEENHFYESQEDPENPKAGETTENEGIEDDVVAFEPLHTIDYFASQGIKIKEDALTNDKLGQQVKSFTAWLKSMKKLHPGKLPEQNEVIERIIQSSAEESNADAEVLTEAMAEVLIKQNKVEKAVEMYEKLSLINPSKSTYFAAKIDILKSR